MVFSAKNLFQDKTKLAISISGVAFALLLILILGGIFAGFENQATAYISETGADVWVMQKGVSNMHMANTIMPAALERKIAQVRGVRRVTGILYLPGFVRLKGVKTVSYIVGFDPGEFAGGPWDLAKGRRRLKDDEVIIDENLAAKRGVAIGDAVTVAGRRMKIAGLSRGTFSLANTVSFVNLATMGSLMQAPDHRSYFLVAVEDGKRARRVARSIESDVGGVNAMAAPAFVGSERRLIRQMGIDIINAMSVVGFIIANMVVGLTIYTATLEKSRDYGILKAVGAARWRLYRVVFGQALITVALGFVAGYILALAVRALIYRLAPEMQLAFTGVGVARAAAAMAAIAVIASYIPIRRVAKLDPMIVFKA